MENKLVYWILRSGNSLYVDISGDVFPLAPHDELCHWKSCIHIGQWRGRDCYAAEAREELPYEVSTLRPIYAMAGMEGFVLAQRGFQLLDWQKNNRFCGRCGGKMTRKTDEPAMHCETCGFLAYPRISPAVMVLVRHEKKLLLARAPHFKEGMFSAVAGFLEVGETIEEAANREVTEEVGVRIKNLRYFQSQPWAFPDSLMIAFFADYAGGELQVDQKEIEEARWFAIDELPELPAEESIARRLIDASCAEIKRLAKN